MVGDLFVSMTGVALCSAITSSSYRFADTIPWATRGCSHISYLAKARTSA
jgi:hypothetical protein